MARVFVGGSISVKTMPAMVAAKIDRIIENELTVLIGDAPGADRCVQQYLASKRYEDVVVFFAQGDSKDSCRNNLGHWTTRSVDARDTSGGTFYAAKDLDMVRQADYGLMIWDGKSKGTLNNIRNLLFRGRAVVVFLYPNQSFHTLHSAEYLATLLP